MAETSKPAAPRASDKPADKPKPKRSETDQELLVMRRMGKMLDDLPEGASSRVVQWLLNRYVNDPMLALGSCLAPKPAAANDPKP